MAQADCAHCGGTGWKTVEVKDTNGLRRTAVRCDCSVADREARLLLRARIPQRYQHCDFESFEPDIHDQEPHASAWNQSLTQAKLVVQAFAREFAPGIEHGLLLMGPCGVGKTHLAVAALKTVVSRGHSGLFYDFRELLKHIQASYDPDNQANEMEVLEPVLTTDVLLMDDLGSSKPSEWARETLGHILNVRYNEKRVTLLTTNYLDPETRERHRVLMDHGPTVRTEDTLADRVGQRIRSRLYEMCRTVEIVAPDFRKEIRQAGRFHA